MLPSVKAELAD